MLAGPRPWNRSWSGNIDLHLTLSCHQPHHESHHSAANHSDSHDDPRIVTQHDLVIFAGHINLNAVRKRLPGSQGLSPDEVNDFVAWLRVESIARRSRLTPEAAWKLSEDIKSDWWSTNEQRFAPKEGH
jgi:hypothetical protein